MNVSLVEGDASFDTTFSSDASGKLITDGDRPNSSDSLESSDRHGRLLLAALLENFCRLYESDSKKAERLFAVLCNTLSTMGILDQENVDELAGVRSQYSKAFKNLMLQAREAVEREDGQESPVSRTITFYNDEDSLHTSDDGNSVSAMRDNQSDIFSVNSTGGRLSLSEWLGFDDTKYNAEFEELGLLGRGGFGAVYHVRNKIDEMEYAVKKIVLRDSGYNQAKIYREIKTLARLEHPNIIRYFSSWLEHSKTNRAQRSNSGRHDAVLEVQSHDMLFLMDHDEPSFSSNEILQSANLDDSAGVVFEASEGGHLAEDDLAAEEEDEFNSTPSVHNHIYGSSGHRRKDSQSSGGTSSSLRTSSTNTISIDEKTSSLPSSRLRRSSMAGSIEEIPRPGYGSWFPMSLPHNHTRYNRRRCKSEASMCLTLFIQMHLCPTTLRDHIRFRNTAYCEQSSSVKERIVSQTYIELFRSILEGARYVHRSGLCHRDIKPSNIFFAQADASDSGAIKILASGPSGYQYVVPKLGDFGLVLPTTADGRGADEELEDEDEDGVGTAIYGAPEQFVRGEAAAHQMTSKCDVFALGIVFFEMLHYTSTTAMERAKLLTDLRNGILPDDFVQRYPAESAIILAMTCHDPSKRPSVEEILDMEIVGRTKDIDKDKELDRMRLENEALRKRILELERAKA